MRNRLRAFSPLSKFTDSMGKAQGNFLQSFKKIQCKLAEILTFNTRFGPTDRGTEPTTYRAAISAKIQKIFGHLTWHQTSSCIRESNSKPPFKLILFSFSTLTN